LHFSKENQINEIEEQISAIQLQTEQMIAGLDSGQRDRYQKFKEDNSALLSEIAAKQAVVDEINQEIRSLEEVLFVNIKPTP
jgi:hypothetical protein